MSRYAEFIDSPAGLRYHDATRAAMQTAISRAAIDLGKFIAEGVQKAPKRS